MKSFTKLTAVVFCAALVTQGCRCNQTTTRSTGEIRVIYVDPEKGVTVAGEEGIYDFGQVPMGKPTTLEISLQNIGRGSLSIDRIELDMDVTNDPTRLSNKDPDTGEIFFLDFGDAVEIPSGETKTIAATYTPKQPDDMTIKMVNNQSIVRVHAENTETGREFARITLKGQGISGECDLPRELDFGAVARDDTFTKTITIKNPRPIETSAWVCGKTSAPKDCDKPDSAQGDGIFTFTQETPRNDFIVSAGKQKDINISFTPTEIRSYSGFVTMRAAEGCQEVKVRLLGEGVGAVLEAKPSPVEFGYVTPGLFVQKTFSFINRGFKPVEISQMAIYETTGSSTLSTIFKVEAVKCPTGVTCSTDVSKLTIAGATRDTGGMLIPATVDVDVSFKPLSLGSKTHSLRANTDLRAPGMVQVVMHGVGGGPDIDIKPSKTINFGKVAYFASANPPSFSTRRVTVANVGTAPATPDVTANLRLGPGGMGGAGKYWTVKALNAWTTVDELCVGVYQAATGTSPAVCSNDLPGSGPGAYDPGVGLEAIGSKALLDIPVRVTPASLPPTAGAKKEWEITIFSNDPDEPETKVTITAEPVVYPPCNFTVTPTNMNFGVVTPPSTKDLSFKIKNNGTGPTDICLITNMDTRAGSDPMFSLPAGALAETELDPGKEMDVLVRAWPQGQLPPTATTVQGAIIFNVSNPTTPQATVNLSATLAPSCLVISPNTLDFGTVAVGCNSPDRTFQVYNACTSDITVQSVDMLAAAGVPAGTTNCAGATACPEFLKVSTGGLTTGGPIKPSQMPRQFSLKYHPLDLGPDTGAFLIKVIQGGQTIDYIVTLKGAGDTVGANLDTFRQDSKPKADILIVVDDSCSMSDKQKALGDNFGSFIKYAVSSQVDFQIGITTTDADDESSCPQCSTGDLKASSAGTKIFQPTTANLEQQFAQTINVGTNGSASETCVAPAVRSLTAPKITDPAKNAGLLRPDAVLAVVCVTDAIDQSVQPVSFYLNQLLNIKGAQRPGAFSYNVVGPFMSTPPSGSCVYDGVTGDDGKHASLVSQSNGVKEEICTPDWAKALENIGKNAFGFRTNFYLTARPDLAAPSPAIVVTIGGVDIPSSDLNGGKVWSYDSVTNSINFEPLYVPQPGETMTVGYRVVCVP